MNLKQIYKNLTLAELNEKKIAIEDRIMRLERDLKSPLDPDFSVQAGETSNRIVLSSLLATEKEMLVQLNHVLAAREYEVN